MAEKMDVEQLLRDAMPVNRREAREIAQEEVAHGMSRLRDYYDMRYAVLTPETPPTPTDSAVPEPADPPTEGPKVVGYVSSISARGVRAGEVHQLHGARAAYTQRHPVILQSEHEAVVRGLVEKLRDVRLWRDHAQMGEAVEARVSRDVREECALLKAENDRLEERVRKAEEEGIGCRDCDDRGWKEDRAGRYVCACVEETEVWQELKAENERLQGDLDDHGAEIRVLKEGWDAHEAAADESHAELQKLKAERDAYADPENWEVTIQTDRNGGVTGYSVRFIGPSDSTEADEGEPVAWIEMEAEVARLRVENERLNEIIRSGSDGK